MSRRSIVSLAIIILLLASVQTAPMEKIGGATPAMWPTYGYNAQRNGMSPYSLADNPGTVKWKYKMTVTDQVLSSPVIGSDGTVYVASRPYLYAISRDGAEKWKFKMFDEVNAAKYLSTPAIGADGTIYAGSDNGYVYALNPNGTLKWKALVKDFVHGSICIGNDGTIYAVTEDGTLYALNPNGTQKWSIKLGSSIGAPSVGLDGSLLVAAIDGYRVSIWRVQPNGSYTSFWAADWVSFASGLTIGGDGTLYVVPMFNSGTLQEQTYLFAINPAGAIRWQAKIADARLLIAEVALGPGGMIYVGSIDYYLRAIGSDGKVKWEFLSNGRILDPPVTSKDGTIVFATAANGFGSIYAVTASGTLKWKVDAESDIGTSPAIAADGTVYVGSVDGTLYAIGKVQPQVVVTPPSAPKNLSGTFSNSTVTLKWEKAQQGTYPIGGYAIYRGTAPGGESRTPIAKVGAAATTFTDLTVTLGTTYYYYVRAYDNQLTPTYSPPSNEVKVVTYKTYTLTASAGAGGSIAPTGAVSVQQGSSKSFTMTPSTGYRIKDVRVDGVSVGKVSTYTFSNVTANHTIEVLFERSEVVIVLQIGNPVFTVDGASRTLDSPPVIKNNRTLLPIRAIVEALGGQVGWDADQKKVTVTLGSKRVELWIGKSTALLNGTQVMIDPANPSVVPEIINSRTMLPLRFVAESLGCTVEWNGDTKTVRVVYQKP
ncbi:PQQ-binding-like beta-propeller repeat protein [Coprothermobacteraceae bacterium]|nr:PQQ-binding-like beta-propeller repeat protein [Coprothermobacteraceae bacterium]